MSFFNKSSEKKNLLIDGINGYFYYSSDSKNYSYVMFVEKENIYYQLTLNTQRGEEYLTQNKVLFEKIIATFKFTD